MSDYYTYGTYGGYDYGNCNGYSQEVSGYQSVVELPGHYSGYTTKDGNDYSGFYNAYGSYHGYCKPDGNHY